MDTYDKLTTFGGSIMSQDKDIRFYKTKQRIIQGMVTLLEKKNFEEITVKDICASAAISRSGFYLHYADKYDLVEKYQLEIMAHANSLLASISQTHLTKEQFMLHMLAYLQQEGRLLALLLSDHGSPVIQQQVKNVFKKNAIENVIAHFSIQIDSDLEQKYFVAFFSNAWFGILQEWINSGQQESPQQLVKIASKIIKFDFI